MNPMVMETIQRRVLWKIKHVPEQILGILWLYGMPDEGTIRDPMRLQNLISSLTASPHLFGIPDRFLLL